LAAHDTLHFVKRQTAVSSSGSNMGPTSSSSSSSSSSEGSYGTSLDMYVVQTALDVQTLQCVDALDTKYA
jgi:hypothetical protein